MPTRAAVSGVRLATLATLLGGASVGAQSPPAPAESAMVAVSTPPDSVEPACAPVAFCEHWQTSSVTSYGAREAGRARFVRAAVDTLSIVSLDVPWRGVITQRFSTSHKGWDIDLDIGDTVRVAGAGRVRHVGYDPGGFGNVVIVRHPSGIETLYAHLQRVMVDPAEDLRDGEPIGLGGSTGRSTGPHLHFEVRLRDLSLDPVRFIGRSMGVTPGRADAVARLEERLWGGGSSSDGAGRRASTRGGTVTVRRGDTLSEIAERHGTTVARLQRLNGLRPGQTTIRAGRRLKVR